MPPVRLKPTTPQFRVKHSTTEPLRSSLRPNKIIGAFRVTGLKILGRLGTYIFFLIIFIFLEKNYFMHFERHFAFQNA